MDNLKAKKRHPEEIAVYSAIYVCAAFSVLPAFRNYCICVC